MSRTTHDEVRTVTVNVGNITPADNLVSRLYEDRLDVALVKNAFSKSTCTSVIHALESNDRSFNWARPNHVMPVDDIHILGTDTPATPTYRDPRGASLETYLASAAGHSASIDGLFHAEFDPQREIERTLRLVCGDCPAAVPVSTGGKTYVPYTLRRLEDGKQISVHHDYHYPLALYAELAQRLDTATLVSFFVSLQRPDSGGQLIVYSLRSDDPVQPRLPSGQWDKDSIERDCAHAAFNPDAGDLILLASGRCFHRVERVAGPRPRYTLGGFLAYETGRNRVFYWS